MNHLKTKRFIYSVFKSHIPRRLCSFKGERKTNSSLVPLYIHCETIVIHSQSINKRQFNDLRNLCHAQNSLLPATNFFLLSQTFLYFVFAHCICPLREQPPISSDLLPFPLIECNSISQNFLLKTHILLSFSNLYLISSFCRLVNINHPRLCHLQKYFHKVNK